MRRLPRFLPPAVLALSLLSMVGLAMRTTWVPDASAQVLPKSGGAARADIKNTRHNLGAGAPERWESAGNPTPPAGGTPTEAIVGNASGDLCVFCHTPHSSASVPGAPLWNRKLVGATATATTYTTAQAYIPYSSTTLNATDVDVTVTGLATPTKLCLSCHDGALAMGTLINTPGSGSTGSIPTTGGGTVAPPQENSSNTMPYGRNQGNADHGFTRRLGTDLRNDHPISFTYNATVSGADGELRNPTGTAPPVKIADTGGPAPKPDFPLTGGKVQCATCHEPHRNTQKFLRKNRLVQGTPAPPAQGTWNDWTYSDASDQICMGCHTRLGRAWQRSAHADYTVGNTYSYVPGPAAMRDFPDGTKVWQAGCLNCHDTHTVAGSRRLLREGVSGGLVTPGVGYTAEMRVGNSGTGALNQYSAQENTCFQCHSDGLLGRPTPVITPTAISGADTAPSNSSGVPNIAGEFARTYRMPIVNADQGSPAGGNATEVHEITDVDSAESAANLGKGTPAANFWPNRHVECTDCHNPHRMLKANNFLGNEVLTAGFVKDVTRRTHTRSNGTGGQYGNIAGGPLRGAWGVEPVYSGVSTTSVWMSDAEEPAFLPPKKGDPAGVTALPVGKAGTEAASYVTREYQICFKCHSGYAIGGTPPAKTDWPTLKAAGRGGTPTTASNGMQLYTNVAREFAVLATDTGNTQGGASTNTHQGERTRNGAVDGAGTGACGGADCDPYLDASSNGGVAALGVNHRSWHPVIFPTGRNRAERNIGRTANTNMNLRSPWDNPVSPGGSTSNVGKQTMQCSDCHGQSNSTSAAATPGGSTVNMGVVQGPHGSDSPFLLKGTWSTATTLSQAASGGATWEGHLCGKCHQPRNGLSGYASNHSMGRDAMLTTKCMTCHAAVPHGWRNKAFLVNMSCVGIESNHASHPAGNNCTNYSASAPGAGTSYAGQTIAPYYNGAGLRIGTWPVSGGWADTNCNGGMTSCTTN